MPLPTADAPSMSGSSDSPSDLLLGRALTHERPPQGTPSSRDFMVCFSIDTQYTGLRDFIVLFLFESNAHADPRESRLRTSCVFLGRQGRAGTANIFRQCKAFPQLAISMSIPIKSFARSGRTGSQAQKRNVEHTSEPQGPPDSWPYRLRWAVLVVSCASLCVAVDFWPFFASHFDLTVGDLLDGRFEPTLLEHWTKVFHGNAQWASPNFFYPVKGILGLSDAFLGLAIPHAMFRSLGADRYLAVQLATMLLTAFGFMAMYFLLRSPLHFARSTALLGASLFVIANTNHINVIHPYILVSVMVAPALFVLAARYWQDKDSHRTKARVWRFLCPLLLALILYTSYYVGWFLIFSSVVLCVAYLMCRVYVERSRQPLLYAINTEVQEQGFFLAGRFWSRP